VATVAGQTVTVTQAAAWATGLAAAYGFNEGTGTTTADVSGNGNTAMLGGATWTTQGRFGAALAFNGASFATIADAAVLDLGTGMTLEAWVYPTSGSNWQAVLLKEQPGGLVYGLYAGSSAAGVPSGYVYTSGELGLEGTAALPVNTWSHLAVTHDGSTLRLYVNGTQVAARTATGSLVTSDGALRLGGNLVWGDYFQGRIDEVRVYRRALGAGEIQADMTTPVWSTGSGSSTDTTAPSVPGSLVATPAGSARIDLAWTASTDNVGVAGYRVERCATATCTNWEEITPSLVTPTTFSDIGLAAGTLYRYRVRASDTSGNTSGYSSIASATTVAACAYAVSPASVSAATGGGMANVTVTATVGCAWTASSGAGWIAVSPTSGAGSGSVTLTVAPNTATTSRTAVATVAGQTVTVTQAAAGATGLVAAYGFNEGTGTTTADVSGNGNTAMLGGATWTTQGRFGAALAFNGASFATIADAAVLDLGTGMTLEAWVYPTSGSNWQAVLLKEQPGGLVYGLYAGSSAAGVPGGYVYTSGELGLEGTAALPVNTWSHLAVTHDGSTLRLYVNGTQVVSRTAAGSLVTSKGALRLGGNQVWGDYFQGRIDEVRVYRRALGTAEIQADMATPVVR
jgi:hypothetical protein